ncbi:MAG: hypothetical protein KJZ86_21255 [Caldilineaceae bacterium]|nr:hypothetical protein [Caldilineaceae bacterium]HRJ41894.1 hypothetical protein [Caldilineaceae bacterium]
MTIAAKKVRVQVDLSETEAKLINHLTERLSVRSRADLLQQAYGTFLWVLTERLSGNRIVSVDSANVDKLERYKELSIPAVEPLLFDHYEHLVVRPESNYRQAYLRGRNMRVGQLIYTMRANSLNAEEAAADMDLPLAQVREAQVYYQINRALIEQEADEEKQHLIDAGISLEPLHLSR